MVTDPIPFTRSFRITNCFPVQEFWGLQSISQVIRHYVVTKPFPISSSFRVYKVSYFNNCQVHFFHILLSLMHLTNSDVFDKYGFFRFSCISGFPTHFSVDKSLRVCKLRNASALWHPLCFPLISEVWVVFFTHQSHLWTAPLFNWEAPPAPSHHEEMVMHLTADWSPRDLVFDIS